MNLININIFTIILAIFKPSFPQNSWETDAGNHKLNWKLFFLKPIESRTFNNNRISLMPDFNTI